MKGVLLVGGRGTRLHPLTASVSKHLLPIHDRPMVFHPLTTLMSAGIREILLVCNPRDRLAFEGLVGDGSAWSMSLRYVEQAAPSGIVDGFELARDFAEGGPVALALGDNIFCGEDWAERVQRAAQRRVGATVFTSAVEDATAYGVIDLDATSGRPLSVEEKPSTPRSQLAVTGLYFFDAAVFQYLEALPPTADGAREITDLVRRYLEAGTLTVERLEPGFAWFDAGTHASLRAASAFVEHHERTRGIKLARPEEVAWRRGFIDDAQFARLASAPSLDEASARYLSRLLSAAKS